MDAAAAAVAASVQADRAQLLFRLAGSSPCVVGDWPRIDLLVLKDGIGTCVKGLWHAPTHRGAAAQCAARRAGQRRITTMHSLHSQRSTCAVLHNLGGFHLHLLVFPFVYQFHSRIEALVVVCCLFTLIYTKVH